MKKLLIAYYTKTNTTKEISEYIGQELKATFEVEILPLSEVKNLNDYEIIVIGAPINGMNWVPDAKTFVTEHLEQLKAKKVGLFYVSYLLDNGYGIWQKAIHGSLKAYAPPLNATIGEFYGRVDKPFGGFPRLLFGSKKEASLDRRDYKQIDEYIKRLKEMN